MELFGILYCLNPYAPKFEILLFNRYVWDKLWPSNGYFEQNMAKKLKVFFKLFKNHTISTFFAEQN